MKIFGSSSWMLSAAYAIFNAVMLYVGMYFAGWMGIYDGENLNDHFLGIALCSLIAVLPLLRRKKGARHYVFLTLFIALSVLMLGMETDYAYRFWLPILSCVFTPIIFWRLFPRRQSQKGLNARAAVEGLAIYIGTMDKERLGHLGAPEDTVEKYEEMLPYAVALGMAETWEKRFSPVLTAVGYDSDWIDEYRFHYAREKAEFSSAENAPWASALSAVSAVTAAYGASLRDSGGSGSDSGGGGSSGGNSGGGGGGGW